MAISLNNTSSGNSETSPLTFAHTVNAGSNKILIVGVGAEGDATPSVDSVVFNTSESLTKIDDQSFRSGENISSLWYLLNPTVTTANIVVTCTIANSTGVNAGAITIDGAKQQAPEISAKNTANNDSPTVSITTQTNNAWIIDCVCHYSSADNMTAEGNQTERWEETNSMRANGSTKPFVTAGATSMSWTIVTGREWGIIAASFEEYSAVAGTNAQINIGDAWKAIASIQINIGDTWKTVAGMQINIGDAWKEIF